jgi:hypothetical protein
MDASWVIFGGIGVVLGAVLAYVIIMLFWPEWVGITGQVALDAEKSHKEGSEVKEENDPFLGMKKK